MGESGTQAVKKPYSCPELVVYGTVEDLTQSLANMSSASDGGTGANKKTI